MKNIEIDDLVEKLQDHPIYSEIDSIEKLRFFMETHVYCVWDFMSLLKFLQAQFCPSQVPWRPLENQEMVRFINEIILAEESDTLPNGSVSSHFSMYCSAMDEVGANADRPMAFVKSFSLNNKSETFHRFEIPKAAQSFMQTTFSFLDDNKAHIAAAAFALGREKVIPFMFQALLDKFSIDRTQAPIFHYYVERHIDLDGDHHGPLAMKMLSCLCDSELAWKEAQKAARQSLEARISLWDQTYQKMKGL